MLTFPDNFLVKIAFPFTDLNGNAIVPSLITAALLDENSSTVLNLGSLTFDANEGQIEIEIPAANNTLVTGVSRGARILVVSMATASGVVKKKTEYLILGESSLTVMKNSFMTMSGANLIAQDAINLSGWNLASENMKSGALISAFDRICKLSLRFRSDGVYADETTILASNWVYLTQSDFLGWPSFFTDKLKRAQLLEANEILQGDEVGRRHASGISSETIGESSVTLRAGYLSFGVSRSALSELSGFIYYSNRIVRA
ncbi:MAG: hypothetical protein ACEQSB_00290 [Undibacterium sp.]